MKRKFLVLTLCFTLIFSSININKLYADGGVISLPVLATVGSLAVASGIIIKNNDDLYDIGRMFYDYIQEKNDITWEVVKTTFNASVSVLQNGLVSTDSKFLDIVKGFFDNTFSNSSNIVYYDKIPFFDGYGSLDKVSLSLMPTSFNNGSDFILGGLEFKYVRSNTLSNGRKFYYYTNSLIGEFGIDSSYETIKIFAYLNNSSTKKLVYKIIGYNSSTLKWDNAVTNIALPYNSTFDFPYSGGYTWDNVESKKENDSIALPIPGNLGQLVGQGSADFWDNTDGLVGIGGITIPNVNNPSIGFDDVVSFPSVDVPDVDVPVDTPFANITEYIIGLVVPSDSYWTDTFGGLHSNFISSFPMVDMTGFDSLIVNGKPFPNIDVKIMGSVGRVVNGDTVNSIVDWLRPIIAGFIFLCLMFFNYRKLYKLIRNSEPFEGIGKVENHAN